MDIDLLVRKGTIVTMDSRHTVWSNGAIAVKDGVIVDVGESSRLETLFHAAQVLDASGMYVFPALINTHTHLYQTLLKGMGDDRDLMNWIDVLINPVVPHLTKELVSVGAKLGAMEALHSGTTTVLDYMVDIPDTEIYDAIIEAAEEVGVRLYLGRGLSNLPRKGQANATPITESLQDVRRLRNRYKERIMLAPNMSFVLTQEALQAIRRVAEEEDFLITLHTNEVPYDNLAIRRTHNMSNVEYLESLGLLSPRLLAVHCVHLTESEVQLFAQYGVAVSYNPVSNMYLGSGFPPVHRMKACGLRIGLATDGAASNNSQDMIEALKFAALYPKGVLQDPHVITARDVLHMATRGAAEAMGLSDQLGSLEPGKKADFFLFDPMASPKSVPLLDPISTLVYSSSIQNVRTVVMDGVIRMQDGAILGVDERRILSEAQEIAEKLIAISGIHWLREGRYSQSCS